MHMWSAWSSSKKPSVSSSTRRVFPLQPRRAHTLTSQGCRFWNWRTPSSSSESASQGDESCEDRNQSLVPRRSHDRPTFARHIIIFVRTRPRSSRRHVPSLISPMDTTQARCRSAGSFSVFTPHHSFSFSTRAAPLFDRRSDVFCCTHTRMYFWTCSQHAPTTP